MEGGKIPTWSRSRSRHRSRFESLKRLLWDTVVETIYSTVYNVEKITARVTQTPIINQVEPEQANQIGALLPNVILKLIGDRLLGNNLQLRGHTIHGPTRTEFITHTLSLLTTTTTMDAIVIPVTFRGSQIMQTVADLKKSQQQQLITVSKHC